MSLHDEEQPSHTAVQPEPAAPKIKRRWWLKLLWAALTCVVVFLSVVFWLTNTESGLRFTLFRIPAWFGVDISADKVSGSVWNGFKGEKWVIKTESANINLNDLNIDWASNELFSRSIHVRRLDIGEMHIEVLQAEPRPKQEAQFPQSLRLPANVHLDEVNIHKITMGDQREILLNQAQLSYHYEQGKPHQLTIAALDSTFGVAQGHFHLDENRPFATDAKINVVGTRDGITVKGQLALDGDLDNTLVTGRFNGEGIALNIDGKVHPFAPTLNQQFSYLNVNGEGLNPQSVIPSLPQAQLDVALKIEPIAQSEEMQGRLQLKNHKALHADNNGIPVQSIESSFRLDQAGKLVFSPSVIQTLQQGQVTLTGHVDMQQSRLDLGVALANMTLNDVLNQQMKGRLSGDIQVTGEFDAPQADWQLQTERLRSSGRFNMLVDREQGQQSLQISKAFIATPDGGAIGLAGQMNLYREQAFKMVAIGHRFNPASLSNDYPQGNVNLDVRAVGSLAGKPIVHALLDMGQSTLSGAKLSGKADVLLADEHIKQADVNVLLDGNRIKADGSIGKAQDKLNLDIDAPRLDQFGFGLSGLLKAKGHVAGDPKKWDIQLAGLAQSLRFQDALAIEQARFDVQASPEIKAPLKVDVVGNRLKFGGTLVDQVNVNVNGSGAAHRIKADGSLSMDNKPYRLNLAADGGLNEQMQWKGTVSTLDISGAFNARLNQRMALEAGAEKVSLGQTSWDLMGGRLNLVNLLWQAKTGLQTKGSASGLDIRQINNLVQIPIEQNVIIGGDWDINYGQNMSGFLRLQRQSGDVVLPHRNQALGLSRLQTDTRFQNGSINTKIDIVTHYVRGSGQVNIGQSYGNVFANAPLSLSLIHI